MTRGNQLGFGGVGELLTNGFDFLPYKHIIIYFDAFECLAKIEMARRWDNLVHNEVELVGNWEIGQLLTMAMDNWWSVIIAAIGWGNFQIPLRISNGICSLQYDVMEFVSMCNC